MMFACMIQGASSKVKVMVSPLTWCIGFSETCLYLANNFILHCGVSKLFGKKICARKEYDTNVKFKTTKCTM